MRADHRSHFLLNKLMVNADKLEIMKQRVAATHNVNHAIKRFIDPKKMLEVRADQFGQIQNL